jgi:hypothetical protein
MERVARLVLGLIPPSVEPEALRHRYAEPCSPRVAHTPLGHLMHGSAARALDAMAK